MDLLPAELRSALSQFPFGSQEGVGDDAKVLVKFFFPSSRYTFLVTESRERGGDVLFFGFCISALGADCDEWGYVTLSELDGIYLRGLTIERDLHVPFATRTVCELLAPVARSA